MAKLVHLYICNNMEGPEWFINLTKTQPSQLFPLSAHQNLQISLQKNEKIVALDLNFILNMQYLYFRTCYSKKRSRWSANEVKTLWKDLYKD